MAKRQTRYDTPILIKENISNLLGKKVNIVLNNRNVIFAKLLERNDEVITISNMRLTKTKVLISDISEIILDFKG